MARKTLRSFGWVKRHLLPKSRVELLEQSRQSTGDQVISRPRPQPMGIGHANTVLV